MMQVAQLELWLIKKRKQRKKRREQRGRGGKWAGKADTKEQQDDGMCVWVSSLLNSLCGWTLSGKIDPHCLPDIRERQPVLC